MAASPQDWVDRYGDAMYRYALKHTRDGDLAADLVQEAFLAAWRGRESFDGRSSEQTWLIGILRHKMLDAFRRSSRERPADDPETFEFLADTERGDGRTRRPIRAQAGAWGKDPEAALADQQFWETFQACVDLLPEQMAQVFLLRQMEGAETADVCKALGITETNLYVVMYRARRRLRGCLEEHWFAAEGDGDVA